VKGWVAACKLRAGDILVTVNGEYVVVEKVQHEILESPVKVYNFEVEGFHTYYVSNIAVLVHNMCKPKNIYNSIKEAPNYNSSFIKAQNGLKKVNVKNKQLLQELNQFGSGWKKVYQNGWIDGQKVSLHYFQDVSGKVFDFAIKYGRWS
jgi:long-subunit acyl-CoA synthetase (AMP-forming)